METMVQGQRSERQMVRDRLTAADAIRSLAAAPAGSRLAALRDAVPERWAVAAALRERRERVWGLRVAAERALEAADENADFAKLAEDSVRFEVLSRVIRRLDVEIPRAEQEARGAERAAKAAWLRVGAVREQLRDDDGRDPDRVRRYLWELSGLLDVPDAPAERSEL